MNLLQTQGEQVTITSIQLLELINNFRAEENPDGHKEKRHDVLLRDIRNEIEALNGLGINAHNFVEVEYTDKKGEKRPCFAVNRDGALQMLNKESAFVRFKTIEYINNLEKIIEHQMEQLSKSESVLIKYYREKNSVQKDLLAIEFGEARYDEGYTEGYSIGETSGFENGKDVGIKEGKKITLSNQSTGLIDKTDIYYEIQKEFSTELYAIGVKCDSKMFNVFLESKGFGIYTTYKTKSGSMSSNKKFIPNNKFKKYIADKGWAVIKGSGESSTIMWHESFLSIIKTVGFRSDFIKYLDDNYKATDLDDWQ